MKSSVFGEDYWLRDTGSSGQLYSDFQEPNSAQSSDHCNSPCPADLFSPIDPKSATHLRMAFRNMDSNLKHSAHPGCNTDSALSFLPFDLKEFISDSRENYHFFNRTLLIFHYSILNCSSLLPHPPPLPLKPFRHHDLFIL